jgi:hypothetical protein
MAVVRSILHKVVRPNVIQPAGPQHVNLAQLE